MYAGDVEPVDLFPIEVMKSYQAQTAEPRPAPEPPLHLKPKYIPVNRDQAVFYQTDLDELIPADHLIRAIWELVCTAWI